MTMTDEQLSLGAKVAEIIDQALELPNFDAVTKALNDAGIGAARTRLVDAVAILGQRQNEYRGAQTAEREAADRYANAVAEAEWQLDGRFETAGNKTYLVVGPCSELGPEHGDKCTECSGTDQRRRAMTADDRKAWKANEAKSLPAVADALAALHKAEEATAERKDAAVLADKALSACRADLDAAIAVLSAWTAVLPRRAA